MTYQPVIYLLVGQDSYLVGLSSYPELEAKYYLQENSFQESEYKLYQLTEPLPRGIGDYLFRQVTNEQERKSPGTAYSISQSGLLKFFWSLDPKQQIIDNKVARLKKAVSTTSWQVTVSPQQIKGEEIAAASFPPEDKCRRIYNLLTGRKLYLTEIRQLVRKQGYRTTDLRKVLTYLQLTGKLTIEPAVKYQNREFVCQRCGSKQVARIDCKRCHRQDYYCSKCKLMGEARLCRSLYIIPGTSLDLKLRSIEPELEFELTALQQQVADQLLQVWYEDYQEGLVWAVCGAGKTEVTFALIAAVLNQGGRVLFAVPRKGVVIELADRLREAFPSVNIKALYGGSSERYQRAELVAATTHQLLRYYQAFDLVILDEIDAFPYQGSAMLKRAVKEAQKPIGKFVALTATPSQKQIQQAKQNPRSKLIKLCARYHGHPLPEPKLITAELAYDERKEVVDLPPAVYNKLELSIEGELAQVFLFVPTRKLVELVSAELRDYFPQINGQPWVQGTHAQDPARSEKREEFLAGEYPVLVTTTIMERGVTVEKANVLVLFAGHNFVFDESTLIQMAGRSGRSPQYPEGKVWFIAESITEEMVAARDMIKELNQEAREKNLI